MCTLIALFNLTADMSLTQLWHEVEHDVVTICTDICR